MHLNTIFIIGPQGSGKGTQARLLAERLKFFHWEMGGILRSIAQEGSELGQTIKNDYLEKGILLPDGLLLQAVESKLKQIPAKKGVIFDGIPRRLSQAEFLLDFLKKQGRKNFATLFIGVPKKISIQRALSRAQLEGRKDDTQAVVEKRLDQYYRETLPVVDYLKQNTQFIDVDGRPSIEEVDVAVNKELGLT